MSEKLKETTKQSLNKVNKHQISRAFSNPEFFKGLTESQINYLVALSSLSLYKKGQLIIKPGDIINNFNIILKGKIKVYLLSKNGKIAAVDIFGKGEPFALGPIFDDTPSETYVLALSDILVVQINKEKFVEFLITNPILALNFFKVLSGRLISAMIKARDGLAYKVEERLIETVRVLYKRYGKTIDFKGEDLAELAGTTRESVSRFMHKCKVQGIIATKRGGFIILDEDKLKNFTVY